MPYIPEEAKRTVNAGAVMNNVGELTYALTKLCLYYLDRGGRNFKDQAEVIAALECTKLELYRRSLAPYEDGKILENGDVYP